MASFTNREIGIQIRAWISNGSIHINTLRLKGNGQFSQNAFLWLISFHSNLARVCSKGCNCQEVRIGPCNGLAPKRGQAICWTNDEPIHWRIFTTTQRHYNVVTGAPFDCLFNNLFMLITKEQWTFELLVLWGWGDLPVADHKVYTWPDRYKFRSSNGDMAT